MKRPGSLPILLPSPNSFVMSVTSLGGTMSRPTSYALHIQPLFRPLDIKHMDGFGVDLGTYDGVKDKADAILERLKDERRPMPPTGDGGPWPDDWIALFERWIAEGRLP